MDKSIIDYTLYLVTDQTLLPPSRTLAETVAAAIKGGVTLVQLREKTKSTRAFIAEAQALKLICASSTPRTPFLINDRVDVALAVDADGVHVGQDDMPVRDVRRLLGPDKIVGVTVETVEQAHEAIAGGADYLGTAAVFPTATKKHAPGFAPLGVAGVREIVQAVAGRVPVVTIGGIGAGNAREVMHGGLWEEGRRGLAGVAVVSAIIAQVDPEAAAKELVEQVRPWVRSVALPLSQAPSLARVVREKSLQPIRSSMDAASLALVDDVAAAFTKLKATKPLVHNITNFVVMNDTANALVSIGASPVMSHSIEEVRDIVKISNALVINIGTLSPSWIASMHAAGNKAKELSIPVVLDPVGAGATPFRLQTCLSLIAALKPRVVKGNAGEISAIAKALGLTDTDTGSQAVESRGVDSVGSLADPGTLAALLALKTNSVVAISGAIDVVSDGTRVARVENGNAWLGTLSGTGCTATALAGAFLASAQDPFVAAVAALVALGVAAELAAGDDGGVVRGPGTFKARLLDEIYGLDVGKISAMARLSVKER
ncbi:Hydroxyethylthiazole kinase family-domain-containing protein [Blyttiomyces helicus]|uniref:Hydroxyethylthiazole kinase family-domain-containing protein n=1 Tax=Blyttiomyces helicus TaxID=388810 RepID=A0A4P9WP00_9FUNG|nr:Hydroxyethylthiazole kinase family-domain-containing protein [Blyttiomyces helicus]|eukprot:RKO93833.1 Hydroxyethylthiazole kinase family-domain-containing protein [Blyttiomyces helicus]